MTHRARRTAPCASLLLVAAIAIALGCSEVARTKQLAVKGDTTAQYNLAVFFYEGDGVPKDFAQLLHNSADVSKLGAKFLSIVFLPEGSGDPASLIVKDDKQRTVTLTVRELTGTVSVSKMTQERR